MTSHQASDRRNFLKGGLAAAGAVTLAPALLATPTIAEERGERGAISPDDIAIFKFLAAVELVETDLWTQYTLLAEGNPGFQRALTNIDPALVRYNHDIRRDEASHAGFINAALQDAGERPIDLDQFRTLRMPQVQGSNEAGYLTNLTDLNVDTSWYTKLRSDANPDFGSKPVQLVELNGVPAIPTRDGLTEDQYQAIANTATFHSPSIDEAGTSLYAHFLSRASELRAVKVLACILPVEAIHFTGFNKALEGLPGVSVDGITFPNLRGNPDYAQGIFPTPCPFISTALPEISVIRPVNSPIVGAVALVEKLTASNLFKGQSNAFLDMALHLAEAADRAKRSI